MPARSHVATTISPPAPTWSWCAAHRNATPSTRCTRSRQEPASIVEKPLCTTLADADRLVDAGVAIGYAENLAYAPIVQEFLSQVVDIDALQYLEVRTIQSRPTWGDFLTEEWGGGALFDLGVHPLTVAMLAARSQAIAVSARLEGADDHPTDEHAEVTADVRSRLQRDT